MSFPFDTGGPQGGAATADRRTFQQPPTLKTYAVEIAAAAGDTTIITVPTERIFRVYSYFLYNDDGTAITDVIVKSGSTNISGTIGITQATSIQQESVYPLWVGRAAGDDFILNLAGANDLVGWVTADLVEPEVIP